MESLAAAIATALLSTGAAAAVSAAKRSSETRDAVLMLQAKVENLDSRVSYVLTDMTDQMRRIQHLETGAIRIESRVQALEAGFVDRRHPNEE